MSQQKLKFLCLKTIVFVHKELLNISSEWVTGALFANILRAFLFYVIYSYCKTR